MNTPVQDRDQPVGDVSAARVLHASTEGTGVSQSLDVAFGGTGVPPVRPQLGIIVLLLLVCGVWAWWPLPRADERLAELKGDSVANVPSRADDSRDPTREPLDLAAFNVPLWVAPPSLGASPPVAEAPPPPPPLKLQLLAITNQDGVWSALVYDPDGDSLRVLREGDAAGAYTVVRVGEASLDLREGAIDNALVHSGTAANGATGAKPVRTLALRDVPGGEAGAP